MTIYHLKRDNDSAANHTLRTLPLIAGLREAYVAPSFHPERPAYVVFILEDTADPTPVEALGAVKVEEEEAPALAESLDIADENDETIEDNDDDIESPESGE